MLRFIKDFGDIDDLKEIIDQLIIQKVVDPYGWKAIASLNEFTLSDLSEFIDYGVFDIIHIENHYFIFPAKGG